MRRRGEGSSSNSNQCFHLLFDIVKIIKYRNSPQEETRSPHAAEAVAAMAEIRVVTVGQGGVGKSATVIYLLRGIFIETYDPTIEDLHRKQMRVDGFAYMLAILDTAGQEEFSAMQGEWFSTGEGFVLMYAINDRKSFDGCKKLRQRIYQAKDLKMDEFTIIVVGNKADLEEEREVSKEEGQALAAESGSPFFEVSAKEGSNVVEVFEAVVRGVEKIRKNKAEEEELTPKRSPSFGSLRKSTIGKLASGRGDDVQQPANGKDKTKKFCTLL